MTVVDRVARLRAISDHLLILLEEMSALEEQKRQLATDHPLFVDLSV